MTTEGSYHYSNWFARMCLHFDWTAEQGEKAIQVVGWTIAAMGLAVGFEYLAKRLNKSDKFKTIGNKLNHEQEP